MYDYYTLYKNSKDPTGRKEIVDYALKQGNKPSVRCFKTTVKMVKKWRSRWELKKSCRINPKNRTAVLKK